MGAHRGAPDSLKAASDLWQTPNAGLYEKRRQVGQTTRDELLLGGQAKSWQPPGTDSFRSRGGDRKDEQGLDQMARSWATPPVDDVNNVTRESGQQRSLARDVQDWRTPSSLDWKGESAKSWQGREDADPTPTLVDQVVLSPLVQLITQAGSNTSNPEDLRLLRRVLNPSFVEELMGWPSGATDYESSETAWFPWQQQMRSLLCRLGWE